MMPLINSVLGTRFWELFDACVIQETTNQIFLDMVDQCDKEDRTSYHHTAYAN
jgi:hypothetical protein